MNPALPPSVEEQLESIRSRHALPPVRADTRCHLASVGADAALRLFAKISTARNDRTLDGFIWKLGGEAGRGGPLSPLGRDRAVELSNAPKRMSDVVLGLSELHFRKAFMILSYSGRRRIEGVVPIEYIRDIGNLPMVTFEKQVWERIGKESIDSADRKESVWDDQKTIFIDVLLTRWRSHFQVYKDGGKEEKRKSPSSSPLKCYFVCNESYISWKECSFSILNKPTREVWLLFMHIHTLSQSKYNPRFSLILSKTISLEVDLATVNFEIIEDINCLDRGGKVVLNDGEQLIHTDGTGYISRDLALMCPNNIYKGQYFGLHSLKVARYLFCVVVT